MLSRFKNFTWLETVVIVANVVVLALIAENSMRFKRYSPYVLNRRRAFADCKLIDEALSRFNKENQETIKTINHKTLEMLNKRAYLTLMPDEPQSYRLD